MKYKYIINILFLLIIVSCNSQNINNVEAPNNIEDSLLSLKNIINYVPEKGGNVSDEEYAKAVHILNEVKNIIESNKKLIYLDYWNLAISFSNLKDMTRTNAAFSEAIKMNKEETCGYLDYAFKTSRKTYERLTSQIPELISDFYPDCLNTNSQKEVDLNSYINDNGLDEQLVRLMHEVSQNDEKYRREGGDVDWDKQTPLDIRNQEIIDSLYNKYQSYIGLELVGKEYEIAFWRVVQHSNIEMMEKYLPIIHKATLDGQISNFTPLKMLIDRIYGIKYNCQIFGSQIKVSLCNDSVNIQVIREYGIKE